MVPWAFSIQIANFSGSWIRDNNKVEGTKSPLPDLTWVITQDGNQISIKPVGSRKPTPEEIYKFDGTETVSEITNSNPPYKVTRSARWLNEGKALELISVEVDRGDIVNKPISLTIKDKLELAESGNVLMVYRTVEARQETIVFNFKKIRFTFYKKA